MTSPVIYVFLNKSLHMTSGKCASQAAHAAMMVTKTDEEWANQPQRTVIVLEARDELHMMSISSYLLQRGFGVDRVIDEGTTEIDSITSTAMVTKVLDKDDEYTKKVFGVFRTYKDFVEVTTKFER